MLQWLQSLPWWLGILVSFMFLAMVFVPLERMYAAKPGQPIFRKGFGLDLCYFLGQYLLWGGLVTFVLFQLQLRADPFVPAEFRTAVAAQPWGWQLVEVIVLSDLLIYWGHRLQHRVPLLWRFHKVHHSAEHLDWLAAYREHPLDALYTIGLINLPVFLLGFPIQTIGWLIAFRGIWAIYIHSNVRLRLGPLRMLIGSPELHHWHHHLDRDAGNYANVSPLMDVLFGTYTCPDREPDAVGIREEFPKNYAGQLLEPFLPKPWYRKLVTLLCKSRNHGRVG